MQAFAGRGISVTFYGTKLFIHNIQTMFTYLKDLIYNTVAVEEVPLLLPYNYLYAKQLLNDITILFHFYHSIKCKLISI